MKKIFIFLAVMGMAVSAKAGNDTFVASSSVTVNVVAISSYVITSVTTASTLMKDRTSITIQNLDTSNTIYCGFNSGNVTTSAFSFMLPANGGSFSADMRGFGIYCLTGKTTGSSNLAVIQSY